MQCFICVTYMMVLCSAKPTKTRAIATTHEERSLFKDVIESLRIRSHLPEDISPNDENNLSQNYDRYGFEDEPSPLLSDSDFVPRRNDRIEMPSLKYRFPKNLDLNSDDSIKSKEGVVLYIDTNLSKLTTQKPKNNKVHKRPSVNRVKLPSRIKENEENSTDPDDNSPFSNSMSGQSQIGNRDSQTVLKPTVIVNIRGSVTHRDSDIRLEAREQERMNNNNSAPIQNIFNINQEVKIVKGEDYKKRSQVQQEIKAIIGKDKNVEEEKSEQKLMICETSTWNSDEAQENRKYDNAFQILLSI